MNIAGIAGSTFTTSFLVDQTPEDAFAAITDVRGWWSGNIEGDTDQLGDEFTYRYEDVHYSKQRITELVPGHRVTWLVLDAYLKFTQDPAEWIGTEVTFEVTREGDKTQVRFAHVGLVGRMFRGVLERVELLRQWKPQALDHERQGRTQPGGGMSADIGRPAS